MKVYTKYKEDTPIIEPELISPEITCNEFLKSMAEAGFDGIFVATSHEFIIKGNLTKDNKIIITHKNTIKKLEQSRSEFLEIKNKLLNAATQKRF